METVAGRDSMGTLLLDSRLKSQMVGTFECLYYLALQWLLFIGDGIRTLAASCAGVKAMPL